MTEFESNIYVRKGEWGEAKWGLCLTPELPVDQSVAAAGCVAIRNLATEEVVLTYNDQRGGWEILGGHLDPLDPENPEGPREDSKQAVLREAVEEGGYIASELYPFAYRKIYNPAGSQTGERQYPELSYYHFYVGLTTTDLVKPTDPERQPVRGTFTTDDVEAMVDYGIMQADERDIIQFGFQAAKELYA